MFDVSDRFLHQLAADRRQDLHRSGGASARRRLRRLLRAGFARIGVGSGSGGGTGTAPAVGEPGTDAAGRSTAPLRRGAQQA